MLRPSDFSRAHRTTTITPYQMIANPQDLPERGASNGGVFHRGQVVWVQESPVPVPFPHTAVGYVDGLGHILIDPRVLRSIDIMPSLRN